MNLMKNSVIKVLKKELNFADDEISSLIEIPPSSELGDFAFPCFVLAKTLKKSPDRIARDLAEKIKSPDFEKVEAKGSYVNFFINKKTLAEKILKEILTKKEKYGSSTFDKKIVMIEFSQPNTHKAFHVGHVRGTSLGESISRILEFSGSRIIRANYSGDTGMHIAKWLWCYQKFHKSEQLKYDESWIASIYVEAAQKISENEIFQKEVEEINRKLESKKDKQLMVLWKKTRTASINAWKNIYKDLNTKFDVHYFESEMEKPAKEFVQMLLTKKIAKISDGATVIDFNDFGEPNLGVFLLLRKDGTVLYGGKDMSLAEKKFRNFRLDKSYYIIGREQDLYIHQVFKALELMKSKAAGKSFYIPLSEVRFPWGKMSSRTGDNILYSDFKKELIEYAKKEITKRQKLPDRELENRALKIAVATMKYTMLKQDANKAIIFNKKEAMNFEGNTGPYLLYTYARARSILKKANYKKTKFKIPELNDEEKRLILQLSKFPEEVKKAKNDLAPNHIANYAYQLAQYFNEFYHSNKVLGSDSESFKLCLVDSSSQVLKNSLALLGIETLEEM
jgi:arginyl-tRNA synthetase